MNIPPSWQAATALYLFRLVPDFYCFSGSLYKQTKGYLKTDSLYLDKSKNLLQLVLPPATQKTGADKIMLTLPVYWAYFSKILSINASACFQSVDAVSGAGKERAAAEAMVGPSVFIVSTTTCMDKPTRKG